MGNNELNKQEFEKYHSAVKQLFDEDSSQEFFNNSREHAIIVIEEILRHAKENINIFCTKLNPDVWANENVVDAFLNAIVHDVKIHICTQENMEESTIKKFVKLFGIESKENVGKDIKCNFMVADGKMFRYEQDGSARCALVCANNRDRANQINSFFEKKLWNINEA